MSALPFVPEKIVRKALIYVEDPRQSYN